MKANAFILIGGVSSSTQRKTAALLDFFGVPSRVLSVAELLGERGGEKQSSGQARVICAAEDFLDLVTELEARPECIFQWQQQVHSVFVYAGNRPLAFLDLVRRLTGDKAAAVEKINADAGLSVLDHTDLCGAMAGIALRSNAATLPVVRFKTVAPVLPLVSSGDAAIFFKIEYHGVAVFLSVTDEIIDLNAKLPSGIFDLREHVLPALPIVLYIKWAFAQSCWNPPEVNACLVIDDPLLRPTHGFVDFREMLSLMKRHGFSTNIAFIPWNWRRSAPEVVQLFRQNCRHLSISVHGNDHIRAEFGGADEERLRAKTEQALERMEQHESATGLCHDRVMVFPQGVFSEAAMSAIKRTELFAAVNNDTISADPSPRPITVADFWDIAVRTYSDFSLFTRRYPWEGVENFAFDILLGKPAISIIHHDYCSDHGDRLVQFVDRLNAVKCQLTWRSLGEVVRRSCRLREVSPSQVEVEMYANELRLENRSDRARSFAVRKRESDASAVATIVGGSKSLSWRVSTPFIQFDLDLKPHESTVVRIRYHALDGAGRFEENLSYKARTMLRRHLCELRDNYVTKGKFILTSLLKTNH